MLRFTSRRDYRDDNDDGFTIIEFLASFSIIVLLFTAGAYGYPQMQKWRIQSEVNLVASWGYESGINAINNPWNGFTIESAIQRVNDDYENVVLTYEGNSRLDLCVTGTGVGILGSGLISKHGVCGQDNSGDGPILPGGPGGGTVIEDTITKLHFSCVAEGTRTGILPFEGISDTADNAATITMTDEITNETSLVPILPNGDTAPVTMTYGKKYLITLDGYVDAIVGRDSPLMPCLVEVAQIGPDSKVERLSFKGATNNFDVPNSIPSSVFYLTSVFEGATRFNRPNVADWDVSNVINMDSAFSSTQYFNINLSNWDTSNVVSMNNMFNGAVNFSSDLSGWDVDNVTASNRVNFSTNSLLTPAQLPVWK